MAVETTRQKLPPEAVPYSRITPLERGITKLAPFGQRMRLAAVLDPL
jgi:hypothetical protein